MSGWNDVAESSDQEEINLENLEEELEAGTAPEEADEEIDNLLSQLDAIEKGEETDEEEEVSESEPEEEEVVEEDEPEEETSEDEEPEEEEEDEKPAVSDRANKRIRQLANERRAAEQRAAELEARLAEVEKKQRESQIESVGTQLTSIDSQIAAAKSKRIKAREDGDMEAFDAADDEISELRISKRVLEAQKDRFEEEAEAPVQRQAPQNTPSPNLPTATQDFITRHEDNLKDPAIYQTVMGISNRMTAKGADWEDPKTYEELEANLAKIYPDEFEAPKSEDAPKSKAKAKKKTSKPKVGTSSKTASSAAKRRKKITLTAQERQIAEEMGISEKDYLAEKIKVMAADRKLEQGKSIPWINIE